MSTAEFNDDTPTEVTVERVAEILVTDGIEFETEHLDDQRGAREVIRTGFNNSAIAFTLDDGALVCDSLWRGQVGMADGAALMAAVNNWNQTQIAPVLRFFEQQESHLVVSAYRRIGITEGLSRNQLGSFVLSSLNAVNDAFAALEKQFPELVTWRYTP